MALPSINALQGKTSGHGQVHRKISNGGKHAFGRVKSLGVVFAVSA
jgi:hypothetical protein